MGQKVSPHGLRVGIIKDWDSKWYADKKNFADKLAEDQKVRKFTKKKLYAAGISKVVIERSANDKIKLTILTAKPGLVIGSAGAGIEELKKDIAKLTKKAVDISVVEIRRSELDAQLTAESIAEALERRISFRRAMKQAIGRTMKAGAKGIKVLCSGRLGGAEIARSEKYSEGNVPLHTLRADIDYGFAEADTTYGKIGVKVWVNHGEILEKELKSAIPQEKEDRRQTKGKDGAKKRQSRRDQERSRSNRQQDKVEAAPKAVNKRVRPKPAPKPVEEIAAEATDNSVEAEAVAE